MTIFSLVPRPRGKTVAAWPGNEARPSYAWLGHLFGPLLLGCFVFSLIIFLAMEARRSGHYNCCGCGQGNYNFWYDHCGCGQNRYNIAGVELVGMVIDRYKYCRCGKKRYKYSIYKGVVITDIIIVGVIRSGMYIIIHGCGWTGTKVIVGVVSIDMWVGIYAILSHKCSGTCHHYGCRYVCCHYCG